MAPPHLLIPNINSEMKSKNKWSLEIGFWDIQEIRVIFSVGKTKREAIDNWIFQRYAGKPIPGACLPSGRDLIQETWKKL